MHGQKAQVAVAAQAGCLDKASAPAYVDFRAGDAGIKRQVDDGGSEDDVGDRVAEGCDNSHSEHKQGKCHDGVDHAADHAVDPATIEPGTGASHTTNEK